MTEELYRTVSAVETHQHCLIVLEFLQDAQHNPSEKIPTIAYMEMSVNRVILNTSFYDALSFIA